MKIYTEVNYIWKDDKLVQTDSKSFDYEGEIESAGKGHWYHRHTPVKGFEKLKSNLSLLERKAREAATPNEAYTKPGGTLKKGTDWLRTTSQKAGHHLLGSNYPDQTKDNGNTSTSGDDSVEEPGTRATSVRGYDFAGDRSGFNRRSILTGGMPGEATPGMKAKKLGKRKVVV